jgi:putative ABC transport system substrate-binding protein
VFGQIKEARGFRQFLMRGVEKVRAEFALVCTANNLLKLAQGRSLSEANVILTFTSRMVRRFKAATSTIPIVGLMADPVARGLVDSLARPGGNITGVSDLEEIWGKRLGFLGEYQPHPAWASFIFFFFCGMSQDRLRGQECLRRGVKGYFSRGSQHHEAPPLVQCEKRPGGQG